jgi:DNA-binding CsgD family transcriptional regulator
VSYGKRPKDAPNWREQLLREVKLDAARTHFVGRLPHAHYVRVLQVSAAHVYLTYPFVLSWSLLEAMACGAPIVGSDTAPVREVIRDGENGRQVEFFNVEAVAQTTLELIDNRGEQVPMRKQARADAQRFSLSAAVAGYDCILGCVRPPRTANPLDISDSDRELLQLLSAGYSNEEIAALRRRSSSTVGNQLTALYQKLGVARRAGAIAKLATLQASEPKS